MDDFTDIFVNHLFCTFSTQRHSELAINADVLVPKVVYNIPKLRIKQLDHIAGGCL